MTLKPSVDSSTVLLQHFIGGRYQSVDAGRWGDVFNPATGQVVARVPLANAATMDAAIQAAQAALPAWADTSPLRRARVMFRFKELLEGNADALAALITREHGKVLSDAMGELTRGIEVVEFACGIPHLLKGEYSEQIGSDIDSWSMRQPVAITRAS